MSVLNSFKNVPKQYISLFTTSWWYNIKQKQPKLQSIIVQIHCTTEVHSQITLEIYIPVEAHAFLGGGGPLQSKKITRLCSFRSLRQILGRLKQECHWLRRVSLKLCAQCKLCLKTKNCFWHKEPRCSHEDCTHYVDIKDKPFVCVNDLSSNSAIPQTWIQVSGQNSTGKFSRGNCSMFVTVFNKILINTVILIICFPTC